MSRPFFGGRWINQKTRMEAILTKGAGIDGAITIPAFDEGVSRLVYGFGTRSAVAIGSRETGIHLQPVTVRQVHGAEILLLERRMTDAEVRAASRSKGYDAIITDRQGTFVSIKTADCVPILLMDPEHRVVAAVHAGWRGTMRKIAGRVVQLMQERFGCKLSSIRAAIGPSIGRCCYEVDEPVLTPLKENFPYWRDVVEETRTGRAQFDLRRLNHRQLEDTGVEATHIAVVNVCTACHPELFYSYRRDGQGTSHMTSGIALVE
jgi:YfiH family protein